MSKSAIKTINAALVIINKAGVNMPHLVNSITDKDFRKNWRNADDLASFIVTCLADCFEAESLESIKDHEWSDMAYACQMYFEGGCDLWNGKQWRETLHTDALIELARLSTLVDRWVEYHAKLARAATDYEMVKQARFEAANSFGGVIGEQEELEEKLNAKGHYAAALLVGRFDPSWFQNHKAQRQEYINFLTKCLGEIVELDHAVALNREISMQAIDEANPEVLDAIQAGDLHIREMVRHNPADLVMIAVRNFERSYADDVNPLGYLITNDGHICKIESTEDCIDGDSFINVFRPGAPGVRGTEAIYYSRKALVMWFMPEEAPEMDENQKATNEAYAERMLTCAVTLRINPHNFEKMMEVADAYALPVYMRKVWTDHGAELGAAQV